MPKLSFIVPVYKPRKSFDACVKSLVEQSLKDFEVIFVLDGPDSSVRSKIAKLAQDIQFNIIEIPHGGACKARNEGAKHAQGDYWVFWDADCVIEPDAAKNWCEILDEDKKIGFVYSGYKFLNEGGAIDSEPFDPWLLRVRNYISTCFPFRKEFYPGWNESLLSLQDWDFWLSVVEKGGVGQFLRGYSFSTDLPTADSISGQGCTPDVWLERVSAVQKLHSIEVRDTCISSLQYKTEGIRLAKLIGADYQDFPNAKPHYYKNIIQVGFSFHPRFVTMHSTIFNDKNVKKYLFWMPDNITEIYNGLSLTAMIKYSTLLNSSVTQFVEDIAAKDMMDRAGFKVDLMPFPIVNSEKSSPLPEKPVFLFDICPEYSHAFNSLERSLPDVKLEPVTETAELSKFTGLLYFYLDRTMNTSIKRALLSGRYVVSNVKAPFAGYVDDTKSPDFFIPEMVDKIRSLIDSNTNEQARAYYEKNSTHEKLKEILCVSAS